MAILVTGAAGFIGYHVARALLARGETVIGIDNLNDYYDPQLKRDRLAELGKAAPAGFTFLQLDFADNAALLRALGELAFDRIVHLGAQAGVRYSIENPHAYVTSNLVGQVNMLELARHRASSHFVYASSSSVYGGNEKVPFSVDDRVDHPISLYAATKRADELIGESYAHLYRLPMTGLRFFTVYGPWGRPDMAMWIFARAIMAGEPIPVFNHGRMRRDFTYIDDIVRGIIDCLDHPPPDDGAEKTGGSRAPHRIFNIGNSDPEDIGELIALLEQACGRKARIELLPMQPGDVAATFADIGPMRDLFGFAPATPLSVGVGKFVAWYKGYHGLK